MSTRMETVLWFLVDRYLPEPLREGPHRETLYRARVTLITPFCLGVAHFYSCQVIYRRLDELGSFTWVLWLAVFSSALLLLSVVLFRRTASFMVSANLYALGATLAVASVVMVSGGFEDSPFSILLPLVVFFTFIMASMRTALFWAGAGLALWGIGVNLESVQFPNLIPEQWMHAVSMATVINAGVTMMGILWFFDFFHRHLRRQLQEERDRALFSAAHDSLTGLANRETFEAGLDNQIKHQRIAETQSALVMMDLNDFKLINDAHGHASGDRLLKAVASNLKDSVRRGDLAARIGGDEFGILLGDLRGVDDLPPLLEKILLNVTRPVIMADGEPVTVGASLGVALIPDDGQNPEALLQSADRAMYRAKNTEAGYVFVRDLADETGQPGSSRSGRRQN